MEEFVISGGKRLCGEMEIRGAKNSVLPILSATLLSKEESVLERVPLLEDVFVMCEILRSFGVKIRFEGSTLYINPENIYQVSPDEELFKKMRASALLSAPLLHLFHSIGIPLPGGCAIGARPLDYHIRAFNKMGAESLDCGNKILLRAAYLIGTEICLDFPSVGATENIMMAASLAYGKTVIRNAAREPEIVDLANFLNKMGAKINGAGSGVIEIEGVTCLHGTQHKIMFDRIELGTMMTATAITGGDCMFTGVVGQIVSALTEKLKESGMTVLEYKEGIRVISKRRPRACDIITMPYPGFPTDMQPQFMALMSIASGSSVITESIFESRFKHVSEMRRMGAKIKLAGDCAVVFGQNYLQPAVVESSDLRAGAALILMALSAEGESRVRNAQFIDRGYQQIEKSLSSLGADIRRENREE